MSVFGTEGKVVPESCDKSSLYAIYFIVTAEVLRFSFAVSFLFITSSLVFESAVYLYSFSCQNL